MRGPTSYLPLATSESSSASNFPPAVHLKRRLLSLRAVIVLCSLVFAFSSLWLLQSATWNWLDRLTSNDLHDNTWLSSLGIHIEHINPPSNVYAPHVQLRLGPLEFLYRGRSRKIGWWRYQDREFHKHEKVQGTDTRPPPSSRRCPDDANGPRLLVGVFTTAGKARRRDMIRDLQDFKQYCTPEYGIECKFVIGKFHDEGLRDELVTEMQQHSDIILLDHDENMNKGKIYDFYRHVAKRETDRPQFIMKQDDDSFVHFPRLLRALSQLDCNQPTYFGACWHDTCGQFLGWPFYYGGMAYGISWPLLSWISDDDAKVNDSFLQVPEDTLTGRFINSMSEQDRSQVLYYSLDEQMGNWNEPFVPWHKESVIVVHNLKQDEKYVEMAALVKGSAAVDRL